MESPLEALLKAQETDKDKFMFLNCYNRACEVLLLG